MVDTSRIHIMLDKVQEYLGQWLESHLKQLYPADWWDRCVWSVLVPEQREHVLDDGAKTPSDLDLSMQISVFRGNWTLLRRKFHLNAQLYDDAIAVKRIRNKYSHKRASEDYDERFDHDIETVKLFLTGLGAPDDLVKIGESTNSDKCMTKESAMTFDDVIETARESLPNNIRRAPWIGLEHGVVPLDTNQKLDQYLAAYGKMHAEKIRMAFDSLENPETMLSSPVSIIDWGCGQGLATCCFFDWLQKNGIGVDRVNRIHLIEPSSLALQRAKNNIARYQQQLGLEFDIRAIQKLINDIHQDDFDIHDSNTTVHLFSNILDIGTIDLDALTKFIQNSFTGRQVFYCVGPLNNGAPRIDEFATKLGISQEQIEANCKGKLVHSKGTISLLTYVIDVGGSSVVRVIKEPTVPQNLNNNITLQRLLKKYPPCEKVLDRVLQFYLMSTELEQLKEPSVDNATPFEMTETSGVLRISFEKNCAGDKNFAKACQDFAKACKKNADKQQTKWRKDIHVSLEVAWGTSVYRLLYATKPIDELQGFDYDKGTICFPLKEFSVDLGCAEKLELDDEKIVQIEQVLESDDISLNSLAAKLLEIIDSAAQLNTARAYISLCEKQKALLQTHAELKKMNAASILSNPLLEAFLTNAEFENKMDSIHSDELISVVLMDDFQRKAVAHSLNNRVSVVVGPPGCGKTQLLLNLLANALVLGKKVLVASKNNKAVDNVADRFGKFDDNGCFLRFGAKSFMHDSTCPKIKNLLNLSQIGNYNDKPYQDACAKYQYAKDGRRRRDELNVEKALMEDERLAIQDTIIEQRNISWIAKGIDCDSIKSVKEKLRKTIADIDYRIAGLGGLWVRFLHTKDIVKQVLDEISNFPPLILEELLKVDGRDRVSQFRNCKGLMGFCLKYSNALDAALSDILSHQDNQNRLERVKKRIDDIEIELRHIEESLREANSIEFGQELVARSLNHYLHINDSSRSIAAYNFYIPDGISFKPIDVQQFVEATRRFLNVCRVVAVTSLSVKNAFPITGELFDLLVIDEASQCDVASALPLILRAKQIVIIGDPMQLRHISRIDADEEIIIKRHLKLSGAVHLKYSEASLWDYTRNWLPWCGNDAPCVLESHYRCHPDIIGYSNDIFYRGLAMGGLIVRTPPIIGEPQGIKWEDVRGRQFSATVNRNEDEASKAIDIAREIAREFPDATIGIVTPFAAQAEWINQLIPAALRNKTVVDTVHKFQGDEKDVMIYSLVVTNNSPDSKIRWIDYTVPNLVNVAVTRAKRLLVVVGNRDYIRNNSRPNLPLGYLETYVQKIDGRSNTDVRN